MMKSPETPVESPDIAENELESAPIPTEEGYEILIQVSPNGFLVNGPLPLTPQPQGAEETDAEPLADLTEALKQVIAITKENPLGEDANAQMEGGYQAALNG